MSANGIWHKPRWLWIATFWLAFGLVDAMQTVTVMRTEGMHHAWLKLFAVTIFSWVPWAAATPLIMRLGRRFRPKLLQSPTWAVHFAACAATGLAFSAWTTFLDIFFNPYAESPAPAAFARIFADKFSNGILSSLVLYAGVLMVSYALDSRDRLASHRTETAFLSERLTKARLDALQRQIEPHFLFNSLSAIAGLVREGRSESAVNTIAALSDFLRRMLEDSARQEVPLRDEIEFAERYLDIQKARFAERLALSVDFPLDLYAATVPNLILQPLVENAIKHGIAKRAQGGAIRIAASRRDGMLTLSVANDGPSLPLNWEAAHAGIGISNVRSRLQGLYGDAFVLSLRNRSSGGVEASVSVPLRTYAARL